MPKKIQINTFLGKKNRGGGVGALDESRCIHGKSGELETVDTIVQSDLFMLHIKTITTSVRVGVKTGYAVAYHIDIRRRDILLCPACRVNKPWRERKTKTKTCHLIGLSTCDTV